jgi:hypothetical protein
MIQSIVVENTVAQNKVPLKMILTFISDISKVRHNI